MIKRIRRPAPPPPPPPEEPIEQWEITEHDIRSVVYVVRADRNMGAAVPIVERVSQGEPTRQIKIGTSSGHVVREIGEALIELSYTLPRQ